MGSGGFRTCQALAGGPRFYQVGPGGPRCLSTFQVLSLESVKFIKCKRLIVHKSKMLKV